MHKLATQVPPHGCVQSTQGTQGKQFVAQKGTSDLAADTPNADHLTDPSEKQLKSTETSSMMQYEPQYDQIVESVGDRALNFVTVIDWTELRYLTSCL